MSTELDVVIIGGGVQGLLALNALTERGYTCALVNDGPLGGGQTLHSHGFLFTGFGQLGDTLPRASAGIVQPFLRRHGIEPTGEWALMPPPDSPALVMLPPANLPSGFGDSLTGKVVRIPDRNVGKQAMVKALSQGHRSRILRGRAALALEGQRVTAVTVRLETGDGVSLGARLVAVAAGCEDIGEQPGIAMREIVERTTNLLLALPSGNVAAWLNVTRIAEIASALVDPSGAQLQLPGGGNGVEIGCAVED